MLDIEGHPVCVAIRVCPPRSSAKADKVGSFSVQVEDATTVSLTNPEDVADIGVFRFSHSYWSADGFAELTDGLVLADLKHPNGTKYYDQRRVFEHFGKEMVQNAWFGCNSTLICFGGKGSGKSWTLFGNSANRGIISMFGIDLFKAMREKSSGVSPLGMSNTIYEVKLTMMEIHDTKVRDLLISSSNTKFKTAVKVRNHSKRGVYVEGLRSIIILSPEDLQQRLDEGLTTRAQNATSFNLSLSSSTVVVGLSLVQKYRNVKGDEVTMSALIDFFDLPVNTWSTSSSDLVRGPTQVKYGNHNGPVKPEVHLSGLVEAFGGYTNTNGKNSAYGNDTVKKLLEKPLSGNCKTYVIAHCLPSASSYQASWSILNLADRVQRLRTQPFVNEEMTTKLTRELKMENDNLKKMLANGDLENEFFARSDKLEMLLSNEKQLKDSEEFRRQLTDDIKSQVKDNEREIKTLNQSQEEKMRLAKLDKPNDNSQSIKKLEAEKKHKPYIYNLNEDSQLTGRLLHILPFGVTEFGSGKLKEGMIHLRGPGIRENHGIFSTIGKENKVTIKPFGPDCLIKINGKQVLFESALFHNDRIVLGGSQIWLFQNPREPWADKNPSRISFEFVQEELALKSEFCTQILEGSGGGPLPSFLKADVLNLVPIVEDANAMCDDMEKAMRFNLEIIHDIEKLVANCEDCDILQERSRNDPRKIIVQCVLLKEFVSFTLPPSVFQKKYGVIKTQYVQSQEDGIAGSVIGNMGTTSSETGTNSLFDISNTEVIIGYAIFSLKPLAYLINFQEEAEILDFLSFESIGSIKIEVSPCTEYFEEFSDMLPLISNSSELVGKPLNFSLKLGNVDSLSGKFRDITCKYKFHSEHATTTGKLDTKQSYASSAGSGPEYKYERRFSLEQVTPKLIESLERDLVVFTFFGRHRPKKTRNLFQSHHNQSRNCGRVIRSLEQLTKSPYLGKMQRQKAQLTVFEKTGARMEQKMGLMKTLLDISESLSHNEIPVKYLTTICQAKDLQTATNSIREFQEEFTPPETDPQQKLTAYQKVSEVCIVQ